MKSIYDKMYEYALLEGLPAPLAKFYADSSFDYWYLDKPIPFNIFNKFR